MPLNMTFQGEYMLIIVSLFIPCCQVKTVIFDKTGTLTHGKPEVTKVVLFVSEDVCPQPLFTAIVGLSENNSEHPLGVAVVNFARKVCLFLLVKTLIL